MENASKALIMAATVLIGMMLIGIFVYVFRAGGKVGEKYDQTQNQRQVELFNSKFEAFAKDNNTITDMISVANLANSVNEACEYNSQRTVGIDIEVGYPTVSISPEYGIKRNYIYIGSYRKS